MTSRPMTDDQLAAALRAHLPAAHAGLRARILAEITTTPQERRLPSALGRLTDADPLARRRMLLLVALLALALSVAVTAIAGALLDEQRTPALSLEPPADLPAFVRSAYGDMPKLAPMTITALRDGTTSIRIYIDVSGAVRIDEFASSDPAEPAGYTIFAGTTKAGLTVIDGRRVWYERADAIGEDPRVFVFATLGAARGAPAPGCEVAVSPGEEYSGDPGRGWQYVALEYVAGRPAHHVRCAGDLWIDVATRLTLRSRAASADAGDQSPLARVIEVTSVELGQPPSGLFELRPPEGVAAITPGEYACLGDPACSAIPAPAISPPPAPAEPASDGNAVAAAAVRAADELGAFDVVVERSNGMFRGSFERVIADGSGRFRIERWSGDGPGRTIELAAPGYHYVTEALTDGTTVWRDRTREAEWELLGYPLDLPATCDAGWAVIGVDEVHGRVADHVRCETTESSDYWIDRETHLVVRIFGTPDPTSGWDASEAVELRLGPSPAALFESAPEYGPTPTPVVGEIVYGWPDTSRNPAGLYSWDGSGGCSSQYCVFGFMHNGYGSGDVEIRIQAAVPVEPVTAEGVKAVTVAGHDGTYRRVDAHVEEWTVEIEGTTIAIRLEARPGASQADQDEAHAIIDSMRTEPQDNRLGFRLVFTLTTNDWDSG